MRHILGLVFKALGIISIAIFGIWGFILCLAIIVKVAGFWGVVVSFFITPITFVATPWYALVAWGNWFPLSICYGGIIPASIFYYIGTLIAGD